jgi:hypothetical protein
MPKITKFGEFNSINLQNPISIAMGGGKANQKGADRQPTEEDIVFGLDRAVRNKNCKDINNESL